MSMENTLSWVSNGSVLESPTQPVLQLSERAQEVLRELEESGADEAPHLIRMLLRDVHQATTDAERDEALVPYEKALAERGQSTTILRDLLISILNFEVDKAGRDALKVFGPWAGGASALWGVGKAIYSRSWPSVTGALTLLAPLLPSLRNIEQVDQLILALPEVLRNQLDALHQQIQQMDDALTPDLGIREMVPALLICATLYSLQKELPAPSRKLSGWAHSVSRFPEYWQKFVAMGRTGSALFAPVGGAPNVRLVADPEDGGIDMDVLLADAREKMIACMHAIDRGAAHCDFALDAQRVQRNPASGIVSVDLPLDVAAAPTYLQSGGEIEPAPTLPPGDSATSAGHALRDALQGASTTLLTWLGYQVQRNAIEMDVLADYVEVPLNQEQVPTDSASDPLVPGQAQALAVATGGKIRRYCAHPFRWAALAGGAAAVAWIIWRHVRSSSGEASTPYKLAEQFPDIVVSLGKKRDWGTGTDLFLGTPALPGKRDRRETADTEEDNLEQLGLTAEQRDSVLADSELTSDLRTLQMLSLATAQHVATQDGWQWVRHLVASEQELLVSQLHVLHSLAPALNATEAMPQTLLDDALLSAGWNQGGTGITVDLGRTRVAGVEVQQQMPLLEYCLLRAADTPPSFVTFRDSTGELNAAQQKQLRAFIGSTACTGLQASVDQHSSSLRPLLQDALRARLIIAGLQAKQQRVLGSGDMPLRGADIVLGFLQGAQDVESSTLTYVDTLDDGTKVSLHVPNYLVLRSASTDPALRGQVVVYRADLSSFRSFGSERDFRQYLDAYRASSNMHVVDGALDAALIEDIVAAAPPSLQAKVRERIGGWNEGQTMFQAGKGGSRAWNAGDSFKLDFKSVDHDGHGLSHWTSALVDQGQRREQQQMESNRLRWTPLGIASADADAAYARSLQDEVMTLHAHARPALTTELVRALRNAGVTTDLQEFNPDRIRLRVDGHRMSLTEWAVSGWQQQKALKRPALPVNLGDAPDAGIGLPAQPLPDDPWPSAEELYRLNITVDASKDAAADETLTHVLHGESALRAICTVMEELADSNRPAEAYIAHLKGLVADRTGSLHTVVANHVRTHLSSMIDKAHSKGQLTDATHAALTASHAALDRAQGRPSSLKAVTLNGHALNGLWALAAAGVHYVFVPRTEAGDQLMTETDFRRWLQRPESETYVLAHAALRHHADLEAMFRKRSTLQNLRLDFASTRGPQDAARRYIAARISDVDEMTVSELERFTQALTIFGSVVAAASCTLASGGSMLALCVTSTLALFAKGLHDGIALLERGSVHVNDAIESIGGPLLDLLDVLNLGVIPALMHKLARRGVDTVKDAGEAFDQLRRQARGFSADGRVNAAFAASTASLRDTGLPMLKLSPVEGGIFAQGAKRYIRQDGRFLQVTDDASDLRLVDPQAPDDVGAPLAWNSDGNQWRRKEMPRSSPDTTTLRPLNVPRESPPSKPDWVKAVPEAAVLPAAKLDELEAVFGLGTPKQGSDSDLLQTVRELNIKARIQQIGESPQTVGLPGDEALVLRAWADTPALGNGRSVETFTEELGGEWNRAARFGTGPVGLWVKADDARTLPGLDALVDAADQSALLQRLGLAEDASRDTLMAAVREALGRTVAAAPEQSLLTWQRWMARRHRLPTAADNLVKHYPDLTGMEAEALVAGDLVLKQQAESWIFPTQTAAKVADVLGNRSRRRHREAVVEGRLRSISEVNELRGHLKALLPERDWRVNAGGDANTPVLVFRRQSQEDVVGQVAFDTDGHAYIPGATDSQNPARTWQEGVFAQLTAAERQSLSGPDALRRAVFDQMKRTPLVRACTLPRPAGIKVKRGVDPCDPPASVSLTPAEVANRDTVNQQLYQLHLRAEQEYAGIPALLAEFEALKSRKRELQKQGQALPEAELARIAELSTMDLMHERNFQVKNFVTYALDDLRYNDAPLLLPGFPMQGGAYSGPAVSWMADGYVGTTPIRRVFVADDQVVKIKRGKGKQEALIPVPPNDRFRADYAMGADLHTTSSERARNSGKVMLVEEDLRARVGPVDAEGNAGWVPLAELDNDKIAALPHSALTPSMQQLVGGAELLPSNMRTLTPGEYRVFEIRSCSEGKVLDAWFDAMSAASPALAAPLRAAVNTPVRGVTGTLTLVSDMNPCATSCDRRLTALVEVLSGTPVEPGLQVRVYHHFMDNPERTEWRLGLMVERELKRTQPQWDAAGEDIDTVRVGIRAALQDKANPQRREAAEAELRSHPPRADEMPVPRLWLPTSPDEQAL